MSRLVAAVVLAVLALDGCAAARVRPPAESEVVSAPEPAASIRQDCHQSAAASVESQVLRSALGTAGLASIYLVLRGAADGAWWGFVSGGGHGARDGAWIGAAAGAGLGLLIGVGVGVKEGVEVYQRYHQAFDACVADQEVSTPRP